MRIKNSFLLHLTFFCFIIHLSSSDILEDKTWSACTEEQSNYCNPGRCKPAPRDYPESYTCECTRQSFLDRSFRPRRNPQIVARCSPLLYNPCIKCHEKNTIKCTPTSNSSSICQCYPEFSESSNCFEKKNPCEVVPLGASLSGNAACRAEFGNLCIPQLGSQKYTCICIIPFRASRVHSFPNCMGDPETPCDRQLCVGFQPSKPKDTSITPRSVIIIGEVDSVYEEGAKCVGNGTCICPKNWHGEHCTQWYASPLEVAWTAWTSCKPDCLDRSIFSPLSDATGVGYKVSKSLCDAEDQRYCGGTMKKWSRCKVTALCSSENEKEMQKFASEVAKVSADVMKEFYNKVAINWQNCFLTYII
ncbi:hypothetical protein ACTXT7_005164 [Hymenolepis weldensis]